MSRALEQYLDCVMTYANLKEPKATAVRTEMRDHLMEKMRVLTDKGMPIEDAVFQAIQDHGKPSVVGYALRPHFPLFDVRTRGTARGVIAIGPRAVGIIAFGGVAIGVLAFGGLAIGAVSVGGLAVALLFTYAGVGAAGISYAGVALGLVAMGGLAVGVVAAGGLALGVWVPGGAALGSYYHANNVPHWLRYADVWLCNPYLWFALTCVLVPIMMLSIIVPNILQRRESRRVSSGERWIAE